MIDPEAIKSLVDNAFAHARSRGEDAVSWGMTEKLDADMELDFDFIISRVETYTGDDSLIRDIIEAADNLTDNYPVHPEPPQADTVQEGFDMYLRDPLTFDEEIEQYGMTSVEDILTKGISMVMSSAGSQYVDAFVEYINDNAESLLE